MSDPAMRLSSPSPRPAAGYQVQHWPDHGCAVAALQLTSEFHFAISSRVDLFDAAVEHVMRNVRLLPYSSSDLDAIKLALAEALANAILHGNRQDPRKKVQVCGGCERSGELLLAVTDEGAGFDYKLIPDPRIENNVFSAHGRGLLLIRHIMNAVDFRLGGRRLVMRKKAP